MEEVMFHEKSMIKGDAELIRKLVDKKLAPNERTPENILELATPEESPLHKYFTWEDSIAAHKYRLGQAGRILRVIVEVKTQTRHYVNVEIEQKGRVYMTQSEVKEDPYLSRQMLDRAFQAQLNWLSTYSHFPGFKENFSVLIGEIQRIKNQGVQYDFKKQETKRPTTSKGKGSRTQNRSDKGKNKGNESYYR